MRTQKWFLNKIGKRIFRDKTSCPCPACEKVFEEGLIVNNATHADYLYMSQYDDILEKNINYRDKK